MHSSRQGEPHRTDACGQLTTNATIQGVTTVSSAELNSILTIGLLKLPQVIKTLISYGSLANFVNIYEQLVV